MHASKGLEFPAIIIAGACSRMMPYYRAEQEGGEAEERRVAYVGVTRAEKKLLISTIDGRYGRFKVTPSRYLYDMELHVPSAGSGLNWSV
jgi:superfamily I DNA/RNA helicase